MHKTKLKKFIIFFSIIIFPLTAIAQPMTVEPGFDPSKLIEDKVFSDTETFGGAAGIQKFLEVKNSVLANTNPEFLVKLKEPSASMLKQGLDDPEPNLGRLRTAAELIWDASKSSGLNPQVILVTLNKEQGLITSANGYDDKKLQRALDFAMGFGCPDSTGCSSSIFPGFYYQLFGNFDSSGNRYLGASKSLMKSYSTPNGRGPAFNGKISQVGDVITLDNTMGGYEGIMPQQTFALFNRATAALYRYTPHVFNGNYNFWKFFVAWFKYPNGTLLKLANGVDTYIIQNGVKQLVPNFVAQARGLNLGNTVIASPTEFESYTTDKVLGPSDNTIVSVIGENKKYVFIENIKHPASDFVIKQRGLDPAKTLNISAMESALFSDGSILAPKDGTIVRGQKNAAIYLVSGGNLQLFSGTTFAQRKITSKQITIIPDEEVETYPKLGFVPPLDGTIFKTASSNLVYIAQAGLRQPVSAEIFKNRGIKAKDVLTLSQEEVAAMPSGSYATPKDRSFFATAENNQLYIFKEGSKHAISTFVAKQRGITPDFKVTSDIASSWQEGIPVAPKDGTIVKGDSSDAVYLVEKGQLRPLTYSAYQRRKITPKKITVLPQAEVDAYGKGETLEK